MFNGVGEKKRPLVSAVCSLAVIFRIPIFNLSCVFSDALSEEPGLSLLGDIQKVVPCSDADKPVGSCGAWRGVCCPLGCPGLSVHTNCTNSLSGSWW